MPYATWSQLWDLITKPPAAIAVYLTLLNIYFYPSSIDTVKDTVLSLLLEHGLNVEELKIAQEALEVFIELIKREKSAGTNIEKLLKSIEQENYGLFKKALYSYLKKDAPIEEVRRIIQAFTTLRARTYARVYVPSVVSTDIGSYKISSSYDVTIEAVNDDYIIKDFNISMKRLKELGFFIILLEEIGTSRFSLIIPAPYMDMDIPKLFEKPERVGVERQEARAGEIEAVPSRFVGVKPSREVLEGIATEALKSLGFAVQTDVRLPAKGGDIEVDVWATKNVGSAQFRVYVSCKNWDRDVDRTVIDHEFGRVLQLYQLPHLRILVVKSLTEPAKKAAFDDGFFVIELGEKATTENAQEIYSIVYNKLKEIFIGIAPEKIMKAIERLREAMKLLEDVT